MFPVARQPTFTHSGSWARKKSITLQTRSLNPLMLRCDLMCSVGHQVAFISIILLAGCSGCQGPSPAAAMSAIQWPEADTLFHQDPRWLGADGAYSVPLRDGRILWLFGDTFVAKTAAHVRSESKMVRNTIAIQRGEDPTAATMTFYWRGTEDAPESFFSEDGERWYWPGHGIRLGPALVLFFQRVKATPGRGLGFEADGWQVAIIDDASGQPLQWNVRMVPPTTAPSGIAVGAALNVDGEHIVALAQREPGNHAGFLVRWAQVDLLNGRLDMAEWWTSDRSWVGQAELRGEPSAVMANAGPESSFHFDPSNAKWVHVRSDGFGATTIVVSYSDRVEGPWSTPQVVFRPPESDRSKILVYAAKGHPELAAGGALAIAYATNTLDDFAKLVNDTSLYYPRFVRLPK